MKKYQQLLLVILSVFSFSCLLIYRHEYNKLRYVLEVLNFFGTPGVSSPSAAVCPNVDPYGKFTRGPVSAWQRISDSLYVYSAYWEKVESEDHVKAFAVGVMNDELNYGCFLWHEEHPLTTTGVFSFSKLAYKSQDAYNNKELIKSQAKPYVLYCKSQSPGHPAPIGVTFFQPNTNQTHMGFVPVVNLKLSLPPQNSSGICVMPSELPQYSRSTYLEFLSFHKLIGINNFIIYGGLDHYNLLSSLQIDRSNNIKIIIQPWNYPYFGETEIMKSIAENDCKTRFKGLLENIVILEWTKFLVPRYLFNLSKLINELDGGKKASKFVFPTLFFCLEFKDSAKSNSTVPIIFRKSRYILPKSDFQVPLYRPHLQSDNVQKVKKDIIAVHQYRKCQDYKFKLKDKKNDFVDTTMFKFQNEFYKSQILVM